MQHVVPCEGLREIQITSAEMKAELAAFREHSIRQNGSIHRIEQKTDAVAEALTESRIERTEQVGAVDAKVAQLEIRVMGAIGALETRMLAAINAKEKPDEGDEGNRQTDPNGKLVTILVSALTVVTGIAAGELYILLNHAITVK